MKMLFLIHGVLAVILAFESYDRVQPDTPGSQTLPERASAEYLEPIRPGNKAGNPWWNAYAPRFLYAPVFKFNEVPGAVSYHAVITVTPARGEGQSLTLDSDAPEVSLVPVWSELIPGKVMMSVTGIGADGQPAGLSGVRSFVRDVPFKGDYPGPARDYLEAALLAARYAHRLPAIQSWKNSQEPDMSLVFNSYPCKTIGSTIRLECLLARLDPSLKSEAIAIARNAAAFLMAQSRPAGDPLAFFPPTYYGDKVTASRPENVGRTMMMEAVTAGDAFLDLFELTGEMQYKIRALGIAETYRKLQAEDGSYPIKADFSTGEPYTDGKALLTPLMLFWQRLERDYGCSRFRETLGKAEAWMDAVPVRTFDWTGQFEDVTVVVAPYSNLTDCTAAPYASWILHRDHLTEQARLDARDLIRLCEDQFVHWDEYIAAKWNICPPCVFEQFHYQTPVDNSACVVANAWLDWYQVTGDALALAKAKALIDNIVNVQNAVSGEIPTTWDEYPSRQGRKGPWVNCTLNSVNTLLRMDQLMKQQ